MPGIVGLITKKPRKLAEEELQRMVAALRHESFYETGTWIDESMGVYVGWAERKRSFADGIPLRSKCGNLVLVFSGEEYSGQESSPPADNGDRQNNMGRSAYLVLIAERETVFPRSLNGRFHGLLVNRSSGTATLFNDRYGLRRLYYHQSNDSFYFAAEAKAILAIHPELRATDPQSLGELISCGCVLGDRTLFKDIQVLPHASAWLFSDASLRKKNSYFQAKEWETLGSLEPEAYYQEFRSTFSRILPRYFGGPERIGISLTGGLDSRMIMAWEKAPPGTLPCYSFGGMFRDCQDVKLARKVAKECGQSYELIPVGKDFLSRFAHYAERTVFLTDGCAGVSRAPDLYANERAAAIAPVRMTGNYGSEVLRRLVAFKPGAMAPGVFCQEMLTEILRAKETFTELRRGNALSFIAFRQTPWHHYGLFALEETQLSLRSPYLDNDLVRTAFRAPDSAIAKSDVFAGGDDCVRLVGDGNEALRRIRTDRGFGGDSGAFSAAVTRAWLEFTFKAEYAYDYGMPQSVARVDHFFSWLHFERLFLGNHKFIHFRYWYREALAGYVRETLLDPRSLSRPYLDRAKAEAIVDGHLTGKRNYTMEIHQLLTLELIHRLFIDSN